VSTAAALDAVAWPADAVVMRTAPDEVLVLEQADTTTINVADDAHALIVGDGGWCGVWLSPDDAERFLRAECAWPRPTERPAFAQGMVAHQPAKLWLTDDRVLIVVPHVVAVDFEHALGAALDGSEVAG
jgi:hypothetical protein